ncbi:IclR family transcriptional regulator [Herbaspirillum sp. RV1423]|uniref:IclR family transcriptional regulator n=1 Tax=Herbaspirillum sp. RV1423 TaxID=1443993 RepID=UPI0005539F05|nr:IclR family transcriptional regulator [Herbaspirillum sp. RV1423]
MSSSPSPKSTRAIPSQTLFRGLEIVDAVANGVTTLPAISEKTGINSSTAHRLASALVQIRYLKFEPRKGYSLGSKLIELGFLAYQQSNLPATARIHLEKLAVATQDTVHLAAFEDSEVAYLDKLPGQRSVEISSRIGGRKAVCSTGVGKALLLDKSEADWRALFAHDHPDQTGSEAEAQWLQLMRHYARAGYAFDLGEDTPLIRCVAVPVRDASARIVAAVSVSSAAQYMDSERMTSLIAVVRATADSISTELGWRGDQS